MAIDALPSTTLVGLNDLSAGLFLVLALAIVATRQIQAALRIWIGQSMLLVASAFLLAAHFRSADLAAVGAINLVDEAAADSVVAAPAVVA